MKPLFIELFAGMHGWGEGAIEAGFRVVGFDLYDMCAAFGKERPKGIDLVLQDVLTLHGSQFRDAAVIVASPPCQNYSYLAMPWSRSTNPDNSKAAKALRKKWETEGPDNRLFDACFRIQREACEAKSSALGCWITHDDVWCPRCFIPLIVENVRGAQPWVGRSTWNFGSFHLWGDVPALMPFSGGSRKVEKKYAGPGSWKTEDGEDWGDGQKVPAYSDPRRNGGKGVHLTSPQENADGTKIGGDWFSDPKSTCRKHGSRSNARKMASAQIAKIPFGLARHIAEVYKPRNP